MEPLDRRFRGVGARCKDGGSKVVVVYVRVLGHVPEGPSVSVVCEEVEWDAVVVVARAGVICVGAGGGITYGLIPTHPHAQPSALVPTKRKGRGGGINPDSDFLYRLIFVRRAA